MNAGEREIVKKKEEEKASARGSVHWSCYDATALDIEVDPQPCRFGSRCVCCCLLLQYLIQSCARGGRRIVEDMSHEIRRAEACVD